jgi:hypothetical protein
MYSKYFWSIFVPSYFIVTLPAKAMNAWKQKKSKYFFGQKNVKLINERRFFTSSRKILVFGYSAITLSLNGHFCQKRKLGIFPRKFPEC